MDIFALAILMALGTFALRSKDQKRRIACWAAIYGSIRLKS
jgi:hypothetical protein